MTQIEALIATLAIELPVIVAAGRYFSLPLWRTTAAGFMASMISHPVAWKVMKLSSPEWMTLWWFVVESLVIGFETVTLKVFLRIRWLSALLIAFVANLMSAIASWCLPTFL